MPPRKRTQPYPTEFKTQAIQLALTSGKSRRVIADELGMGFSTLTTWLRQQRHSSDIPQSGSTPSGITAQQALEQEVRRLQRENEVLRQEREILKAATKFFAKEHP
jgi:transposase